MGSEWAGRAGSCVVKELGGARSGYGSRALKRDTMEGEILDCELARGVSACSAVAEVDGDGEELRLERDGEGVELTMTTGFDVGDHWR